MKKYPFLLLFIFLYAGLLPSALAQEEQETTFSQPIQELPFTETVYLQEQKEIQQTASYFHTSIDNRMLNSLSYEIEYGITDWLQVSAELAQDHRHSRSNSYATHQLGAGTMVGIINTPGQALSLAMEVEFPFRKPDLGEQEGEGTDISYTPTLIYARQVGNLQLHLNGGGEFEAGEHEWFYNAAAVYGKGNWHPLLEVNGTHEEEQSDWYLAPGIVLNGEKGWEFIAGVRRSLLHPNWGLSLKLLYEFTAGKQQ